MKGLGNTSAACPRRPAMWLREYKVARPDRRKGWLCSSFRIVASLRHADQAIGCWLRAVLLWSCDQITLTSKSRRPEHEPSFTAQHSTRLPTVRLRSPLGRVGLAARWTVTARWAHAFRQDRAVLHSFTDHITPPQRCRPLAGAYVTITAHQGMR